MISIIVAVDSFGGFAKDRTIPWHYKQDLAWFQKKTKGKVCVMGKNTYLEMQEMANSKKRDITNGILPNRTSYVISRTLSETDVVGATLIQSFNQVTEEHPNQEIMVLGGEKLFLQAFSQCDTVYLTAIDKNYDCDTFFPIQILSNYKITEGEKVTADDGVDLMFVTYERVK